MSLPNSSIADQLTEHLADVIARPAFIEVVEKSQAMANRMGEDRIVTISLHFDKLDPLAVLERLSIPGTMRYHWEKPELDLAISASGTVLEIKGDGPERFKQISRQIEAIKMRHDAYSGLSHSLAGLHFMGGFSFFDTETNGDWKNFGTARFVVPEWIFVRDGNLGLLTITQKVYHDGNSTDLSSRIQAQIRSLSQALAVYRHPDMEEHQYDETLEFSISEGDENLEHWHQIVTTATDNIRLGVYDKIVLARTVRVEASRPIVATRLVHHLRREYPNCYTFLLKFHDTATFVGSTPERLVSIQSGFLNTEGLAGSIPRGLSATDDAILEKRLLLSDKDQDEHRFVVDSIMSRLRTFTSDIHTTAAPGIRKFSNVQHLYTPISARLPEGTDPFDVIESLHPTPAVGGAPRQSALLGIPQLEGFRRGWYAGPIGWVNGNGRGEFSVAIRSGLIKDDHATFYAGCGIVEGSDPDNEWAETELKLIPMMTALRHA
jgi:menaquinone-specific isochorismate synthase